MNKDRFEAFSDSVFAFAITLLVLGFVLPPLGKAPHEALLARTLLDLWPNLLAYALSFAVIGIMWQNHSALFRVIARLDRTTVFINLLLLAGIIFMPFATSTLGAYPTMHSSTLLYGIVASYCATFFNLLFAHLVRVGAFDERLDTAVLKQTQRAYFVGLAGYYGATLLALWLPILSFTAYIAITIYYLIPRGVDDDLDANVAP